MVKYIAYGLSVIAIIFFAACRCPFCNGKQDYSQKTTQPSTATSNIADTKSAPILITNADQFEQEVLKSTTPVIVDFSAEWCGACKASKPTFDAVAAQLGSSYKFVTVDVDKAEKVAQNLGIQGIPTFMFFKDGKEVKRITGAIVNKDDFISTIKKTFEQ